MSSELSAYTHPTAGHPAHLWSSQLYVVALLISLGRQLYCMGRCEVRILISGCWGVCGWVQFQGLKHEMSVEDWFSNIRRGSWSVPFSPGSYVQVNSYFIIGCFSVSTLACYSFLLGYYWVLSDFVCWAVSGFLKLPADVPLRFMCSTYH